MEELATWTTRRWLVAAAAALVAALVLGLPSDVIPNPVFGRPVDVTWWSYPVLVVTSVLSGLLIATYVSDERSADAPTDDDLDGPARAGGAGGLLTFFAVGCPVCNKVVVLALGTTGALDWFAPAQPFLAMLSIGLLSWALRARFQAARSCIVAR